MVYDTAREHLVLFGGAAFGNRPYLSCVGGAGVGVCGDTWAWGPRIWEELDAEELPGRRGFHALAYDSARGETVMFGGCNAFVSQSPAGCGGGPRSDTWLWDGERWERRAEHQHPLQRSSAAMAEVPGGGPVLLFGGDAATRCAREGVDLCDDTWTWSGVWRQAYPETRPPPREEHAMAAEAARGTVLLFGGVGATLGECGPVDTTRCSDTWTWDGESWIEHHPELSPPPVSATALAHDPQRARTVLFGGVGGQGGLLEQTWEWDGARWHLRRPLVTPAVRRFPALAWDPGRRGVLLFGGASEGVLGCDGREGEAYCRRMWEYAPQRTTPHTLVAVDMRSTATVEPSPVDRSGRALHGVGLRTIAGGAGHSDEEDGEHVPGYAVRVSAFRHGGWLELHRSEGATPQHLDDWAGSFDDGWTCGEPWCEGGTIDRWVAADGHLYLDLSPLAPQGRSTQDAAIAVDYVEVRVEYWRTGCERPHVGNPEGTPDGTSCSDGRLDTEGERCCAFECVVGGC